MHENGEAEIAGGFALELIGITKRFGGLAALDNVSLDLLPGEVLGVLGENGAGKSTLMNIVRGLLAPDSGVLRIHGQEVTLRSANDARNLGIGMVHQHFLLVPSFTVGDNLVLGAATGGVGLSEVRREILARAREVTSRLQWTLPLDTVVSSLPVGTRQRVEIVRTLLSDPKIILFDEPTAVLGPSEIDDLLRVLGALRDEGRSLIFVSHKLKEVMAVCARVTVLRRGKVVGTVRVAETSEADLAWRMIGDEAAPLDLVGGDNVSRSAKSVAGANRDAIVLDIRGLSTARSAESQALHQITLQVKSGEVVGIAGVDGNGQTELVEALSGLRRWTEGTVAIVGESVENFSARTRRKHGLAVIPPDRQRDGLALDLSVGENLISDALDERSLRFGPLLRLSAIKTLTSRLVTQFDIRTPGTRIPARSLSGGNQQKIVIARALHRNPKVVVAASPTRGLDVHATAYVHQNLREQCARGAGILLISTELDEVLSLSDRIAVLYEGRIMGVVPARTPREAIGLMMGGQATHV
jgi:simple sugar transport system ATP-binding protein